MYEVQLNIYARIAENLASLRQAIASALP